MADEKKTDAKADEAKADDKADEGLLAEPQVVSEEPNAPTAPSPPGFERGMNWNSDDARRAYEGAGTTLEEEQRKVAE